MSSFGRIFRVTTAGESHCRAVTVIVEGVPPGVALAEASIQPFLDRRRPGQSLLATPRSEQDLCEILSGTERGVTLGTPVCVLVKNKDTRPEDYSGTRAAGGGSPRPSHADFTYFHKYGGHVAASGGGRASARETVSRVVAGAIAMVVLRQLVPPLRVVSYVSRVGKQSLAAAVAGGGCCCALSRTLGALESVNGNHVSSALSELTSDLVDKFLSRAPCQQLDTLWCTEILSAKERGDSVGGVVSTVVLGLPIGLGEPVFDKFEALLAHAMLSIPASKGFAFGSGFRCAEMNGSIHNDPFVPLSDAATDTAQLTTSTNYSGGVQGGITNGNAVYFDTAFKPPATIQQTQHTARYDGEASVLEGKGRHDPCVVPRAVPIVEAMTYIVVLDMLLLQRQRSLLH
jgi:chorismate synthase